MIEIPSLRPETRYGMPTADMLLFNRQYIVGYSTLFRQPRWAMELIDPLTQSHQEEHLSRLNNFREDLRVPEMFRATLADYTASGYDRGHLISSADRMSRSVLNSETFLLTNMSPQAPNFNRGVWKELESATRELAGHKDIVEVYMICGPLFNVGDPVDVIGPNKVVVPDAYFKSILAENRKGTLQMWTFAFPNKETKDHYSKFLVPTENVERWAGLPLWDRLHGAAASTLRRKVSKIWPGGSPKQAAGKSAKKSAGVKKAPAAGGPPGGTPGSILSIRSAANPAVSTLRFQHGSQHGPRHTWALQRARSNLVRRTSPAGSRLVDREAAAAGSVQ